MKKGGDFHSPGEKHGLFVQGWGRGGFRVGCAELDPGANANIVEDLEEPFDFGMVEAKGVAEVAFSEAAGFIQHLVELPAVFLLLVGEGFLEEFLILFCFLGPGWMAGAKVGGEDDGVTLEEREEHFALAFSYEERAVRVIALEELHGAG